MKTPRKRQPSKKRLIISPIVNINELANELIN
jgi:hypothetical protein